MAARTCVATLAMKLDSLLIRDMGRPAQFLKITTLILRSQNGAEGELLPQATAPRYAKPRSYAVIQSQNKAPAASLYFTTSINLPKLSTTSYFTFSGAYRRFISSKNLRAHWIFVFSISRSSIEVIEPLVSATK